ncbi:hypothetical protein L6475_03850 [Prevotella sp. E9-3]|uniref:hypothetical protein n=1 Tax=Prevotella sp. E9-3 TaxID=2913621 RepID=UPI001EDB107D|nr:hypothetical protein [Prevotella sp. E9-3]UKK49105.1 hypothetical protein L6475_03850 [Prevotella sp. E9-3]
MKKTNFLKTLLVAVGMLAGVNVSWATDVPYNVGSSTSDAWGAAFSDVWTMTGDGAVTVTFTNHCATTGNWWENWQLLCGNSNYTPAAHADGDRYFQLRSDRWDDVSGGVGLIASDDYFTDFKTFQNEATVNLMIVRSGTTVTVNVAVTKSATTRTMTFVKTGLSGTLNFFLTQSSSYMTITQQNQTTEMAGTVTCNALVNFSNFTSEKTADTEDAAPSSVTGGKGTMSTNNAYQFRVGAGDYRLGLRNGANTVNITSTEYAGSKDIVTISFDMALSQMNADGKTSYFYLKDASNSDIARVTMKATNNSWSEANHYLQEFVDNTLGLDAGDIDYAWSSENWGKKVHFTIELNYLTGKITTTTVCATANNTTNTHTVTMTNRNPVAKFVVGAEYNCNYRKYRCQFDNLLIQTEKGDYNTTANITLSFKDNEGNDISALYTGTSDFTPEKGSTFKPSDYYPTVMYDDNFKYTYTSGGDAFKVTSDAVVNLVYTKSARPTYTFNVTANYGAKNKKIVDEVSVKETADYTYYYPRYILDGTTLYEYASSTDANASASYWTSTNTNVVANANYTLTYNAIEGECVYFSEGEDVAGATAYTAFKRYMSGGSSAVFESATKLTTLEKGVYKANMRSLGRTTGDRHTYLYKNSDDTEENLILHKVVSSNSGTDDQALFSLDASTDILAKGGYSTTSENGAGIDYVYIMKLPSTVSATIGSTGWTTFASPYALDLSAMTASTGDVTAYYASTVTGGYVKMTETNKADVKAGEGLALYGTPSAVITIPVVASGTAIDGNLLKGCTTETELSKNADYYVLVNNNGTAEFQCLANQGATIPAGKAYLDAPTAGARLSIVFDDDETTGLGRIENSESSIENAVYNLQGQRINSSLRKGLYIKNGKKVIVK